MSEIVSIIVEQIRGIIIGIIISLTVYLIVTFIPIRENARYKAMFYRRKISKLIHNPKIEVGYTVKTKNLEDKEIREDNLTKQILENLEQDGFRFKGESGDSSVFQSILGRTEAEIMITPSYIPKENEENEEELIVDYLECDFKLMECKYNNFDGHLLDLIQIFRKLERNLENMVGNWTGESLTCEIKRLYEFVGVLKDLKMSSLTGKIGGQYSVELFENKLVVYGTIETGMTSMIRDIITYYY